MSDTATLLITLSFLPVWLGLELVLLWRRRPGSPDKPKTISMVMRDRAWHLNSLPYFFGGMCTHWWVPAKQFAPVWAGVAFWVGLLGLIISDVVMWRHPVETWPRAYRWFRFPAFWLVIGAVAGFGLFPQTGIAPWD